MESAIEKRLNELGLALPFAATPAANYVPYVVVGDIVYIAGQVPVREGEFQYLGKVGVDLTIEEGQKAAEMVLLNILAQLKAATGGDLDRVKRAVRLGGFVNAPDGFESHPAVINGASDLLIAVMGEAGRHARAAVGANGLPFNVSVEIEAVFQLK